MATTAAPSSVATEVDRWLSGFDEALSQREIAAAAASCSARRATGATSSRSRGTSRPWKGAAGVRTTCSSTSLGRATSPRGWRATEEPARSRRRHRRVDRVRDRGRPRSAAICGSSDGKAWTLLTALDELKGYEENAGVAGPRACSTASARSAARGSRDASARRRNWATRRQPYVVIVGGGQGGIALGARLRQLRRADDHRRAQRTSGRLVAQALQVAVPARPGLVRPPPVHQVPGELAGVLAEGQDRRLARDVHARDGAQLLGLDRVAKTRPLRRGCRRVERRGASATGNRVTLRPKQLVMATGMSGRPHMPEFPGMDVFKGDQHHSSKHPGPDAYRGQAGGRDRLQQLGPRHLRGAVGARRRRDDGAALVDPRREVRHADGRSRSARCTPRRRVAVGHDDREGRHDVRLAALPDHGRTPGPGLRARSASATPDFYARLEAPASSTIGARTTPGCS